MTQLESVKSAQDVVKSAQIERWIRALSWRHHRVTRVVFSKWKVELKRVLSLSLTAANISRTAQKHFKVVMIVSLTFMIEMALLYNSMHSLSNHTHRRLREAAAIFQEVAGSVCIDIIHLPL